MTNSNSNPLLRRSQPIPITENPYLRFNLTENPFPSSPTITPHSSDPKTNGEIYVEDLRANEQQQFERLLILRQGQPEPRLMAFLMDYATRRGRGIGKTAFLHYQRRQIMADLGDRLSGGTQVLLAAHLLPEASGGTRRFWQFTRQIARALNDGNCIAWALWRLRAMSGEIPDGVINEVDPTSPGMTLGNDQWLSSRVDVMFTLNRAVERTLQQAGIREAVAQSLASDGHNPEQWKRHFLDRQGDYWWRQQGEQLVFDDLVRLFEAAGINRTLLLVDEVEKIVMPQNRDERRGFIDDIRRYFVDGPFQSVYTHFYGLLLTIHPSIQEIWAPHWSAAGLDRVCTISGGTAQEYTIYFHPLKPEDAAERLVLAYLDYFRDTPDQKGQLYPFDQDAVITALRISGGVPGLMLQLLHLILEKALKENWQMISAAQIDDFHEAAIPSEPAEEDEIGELPQVKTNLLGEE